MKLAHSSTEPRPAGHAPRPRRNKRRTHACRVGVHGVGGTDASAHRVGWTVGGSRAATRTLDCVFGTKRFANGQTDSDNCCLHQTRVSNCPSVRVSVRPFFPPNTFLPGPKKFQTRPESLTARNPNPRCAVECSPDPLDPRPPGAKALAHTVSLGRAIVEQGGQVDSALRWPQSTC